MGAEEGDAHIHTQVAGFGSVYEELAEADRHEVMKKRKHSVILKGVPS